MSNILCSRLRNHLSFRLKNSRLMSGLNVEMDPEVKRIQRFKKMFALSLFGITLGTALLVKNHRKKEWFDLMQKTKRLQVMASVIS